MCWTTAREPDRSSFKPHRPRTVSVAGLAGVMDFVVIDANTLDSLASLGGLKIAQEPFNFGVTLVEGGFHGRLAI